MECKGRRLQFKKFGTKFWEQYGSMSFKLNRNEFIWIVKKFLTKASSEKKAKVRSNLNLKQSAARTKRAGKQKEESTVVARRPHQAPRQTSISMDTLGVFTQATRSSRHRNQALPRKRMNGRCYRPRFSFLFVSFFLFYWRRAYPTLSRLLSKRSVDLWTLWIRPLYPAQYANMRMSYSLDRYRAFSSLSSCTFWKG